VCSERHLLLVHPLLLLTTRADAGLFRGFAQLLGLLGELLREGGREEGGREGEEVMRISCIEKLQGIYFY